MKRYIKKIQKKLLKLKKSSSISGSSRSDDPSFSSGLSSESSEPQTVFKKPSGVTTPTSVLPNSNEIEWTNHYITSDFAHAFQMMDRDGDGKIGKEELQILLSKIGGKGLTNEEIQFMLTEVDKDGDGCVSLDELRFIGEAIESLNSDDELRETFDFFDADHDGKISAEELYSVFKTIVGEDRCTLDECERMINGVDSNGDGFVCFQDFTLMMESQLKG